MPISIAILFGTISVIATTMSAVAAWLALKVSRESHNWQIEQSSPRVAITVRQDPHSPTVILLVIENTGGSTAYDIRFNLPRGLPARAWGLDLESVRKQDRVHLMVDGPLVSGIPALAPGDRRVITWGQFGGIYGSIGDSFVRIRCTFCDESRREKHTLNVLEVRSFIANDASEREPLSGIEQAIKSLADHWKGKGEASQPLVVETPQMQKTRHDRMRDVYENQQKNQGN